MKNILSNKKKLVSTILISLMITTIGFSVVIAKPPADKTPDDDDWTGAGTGDMYTFHNDDVGIGTDSPATKLDVNGVITAFGGNSNDWNTAFSWGDHSTVGYLTSYTETDPVYIADPAYGITDTQISNWDSAFSWGDHSSAGYDTTDDTWEMTVTGNITTLDNVTIGDPPGPISNTKLYVTADDTDFYAITGYSSQSGSSGVSGICNNGNGVFGITSSGKGIYGYSVGSGDAIYGYATSTGLAGNFQGDVNINGDLTVSGDITFTDEAKVEYLKVPAAAFVPNLNNFQYGNVGYRLLNVDSGIHEYYAPVYLPNNSRIINMTFHWNDNSAAHDGNLSFYRTWPGSAYQYFIISTDGNAGDVNSSYYAPGFSLVIDNSNYGYYLKLRLDDNDIYFYMVTIEYEYS